MNLVLVRLVRMAPELMVRTALIALTVIFLQGILGALLDLAIPAFAWLIAAATLWIPSTVGLYIRAGEATFQPWRKLDRRQKLRNWAGALWSTPMVMLFPLWLAIFYEPSALIAYWDLYVLFFGLPFVAASALYFLSTRVETSS